MPINNPAELIDEFKKSGEFDRLRRELLTQFQRSDGISLFKSRIEEIARQRLISDQKLLFTSHEQMHNELMQELDRYPIVERAAADLRTFSDPSFTADIRTSIQNIVRKGKGPQTAKESISETKQATITTRADVTETQEISKSTHQVGESRLEPETNGSSVKSASAIGAASTQPSSAADSVPTHASTDAKMDVDMADSTQAPIDSSDKDAGTQQASTDSTRKDSPT